MPKLEYDSGDYLVNPEMNQNNNLTDLPSHAYVGATN
jgi:hypothetical protein